MIRLFAFLIVCSVGTAEMGYSAIYLKTVYHLATESHEQWNPERENFPAGFQLGAHHHHDASGADDCGDPSDHSASSHFNELAGASFVSLQPTSTPMGVMPLPLVIGQFLIATSDLSDQGHRSNLFRPPIA